MLLIHSIYHVDFEEALVHCFEKELHDNRIFVCILPGHYLMYSINLKQNCQWHGKQNKRGIYDTAEKITSAAYENGCKYDLHTQEYPIAVTEVFDEKSTDGNLLLDFLTRTSLRVAVPSPDGETEARELIKSLYIFSCKRVTSRNTISDRFA